MYYLIYSNWLSKKIGGSDWGDMYRWLEVNVELSHAANSSPR